MNQTTYNIILIYLILAFMIYTLYLIFQSRLIIKKYLAQRTIKKLEKESNIFNEESLYQTIQETFETLQDVAVDQRVDIAKKYMTPECFDTWQMKVNWTVMNQGYIISHDTTLTKIWIVSIQANLDKQDSFWVYLEGYHDHQPFIYNDESKKEEHLKTKGYYASIEDNTFQELWEFIRKDDQFYLNNMVPYKQFNINKLKNKINL